MKVIGKGRHSDFIVLVNKDELCKLLGKYYSDLDGLKVGAEINVSDRYCRLAAFESNEHSIKAIKDSCASILRSLDVAEVLIVAETKKAEANKS